MTIEEQLEKEFEEKGPMPLICWIIVAGFKDGYQMWKDDR